ncbi:hypothetical protein HYX58_04010 [Candidatus Dependentiae bacterium]|nr:hypothetical protein [Candidatus Dependentiae bacterium]
MKISTKSPALALAFLIFSANAGVLNNIPVEKTSVEQPKRQFEKISRKSQMAQFTLGAGLVLISAFLIDTNKNNSPTEEIVRLATGLPIFGIGCELAYQSLSDHRFTTAKDYFYGAAGHTAFGTLSVLCIKFYISKK